MASRPAAHRPGGLGPFRTATVVAAALALSAGCRPAPPPPSVLLISVDTLRADEVIAMPFLARLEREGRSFPRVYSSSNWTLPSHASLFLSRPYSDHRVPRVFERPPFPGATLPAEPKTLAEAFQGVGYRTFATVEGGFLDSSFGFARGFERYEQVPAIAHEVDTDFGRHLAGLRDFLGGEATAPVFAFVHTYRVHDYFLNLPQFQRFLEPEDARWKDHGSVADVMLRSDGTEPSPEFLHRLYQGAAAETDELLETLVEGVLAASPDRRWLIVVTSDHGECFTRNARLRTHGSAIVEDQIRVPWIAWTNDGSLLRGPVEPLVSSIDVAPSILGWAGIPVPESFLGRRDLLTAQPSPRAEAVETAFFPYRVTALDELQLALLEERQAVLRIVAATGGATETCLLLRREQLGRSEWVDGADGCRPLRHDARERIRLWIEADRRDPKQAAGPVDERLVTSLKALGYISP